MNPEITLHRSSRNRDTRDIIDGISDFGRAMDSGRSALARLSGLSRELSPDITLNIHTSLAELEDEWRQFEQFAECTPFQTFEWLSAWQRHIGALDHAIVVVAVGRFADGNTAFILPLAVDPRRFVRRLCWLGQELCDYNAPLLARDFSQHIAPARFVTIWRNLQTHIQSDPKRVMTGSTSRRCRRPSASRSILSLSCRDAQCQRAHITQLGDDWETFYRDKRSSATRRRDRAKRQVTCRNSAKSASSDRRGAEDVLQTLETLWEQKTQHLRAQGYCRHFRAAGLPGTFRRLRAESAYAASGSRQPHRDRRRLRRGEFRDHCSATAIITCCRVTDDTAPLQRHSVPARCICAN